MGQNISARGCMGADGKEVTSDILMILGSQWGDEGKGKLVDLVSKNFDICARFNGGSNAGHTLVISGKKFAFHLLPCGVMHPECENIIGNGVVVHLPTLAKEVDDLKDSVPDVLNKLFLSDRATLLLDVHQKIDAVLELEKGSGALGTTKRGIGPAYATKVIRNGLRLGDLKHWDSFEVKLIALLDWVETHFGIKSDVQSEIEVYKKFAEIFCSRIIDTNLHLTEARHEGKRILLEGANAALLDIEFGTFPFVTSSSTTAGGACTGLGLPPQSITGVIGVVKAYTTRVGAGPFPTELLDETGELLRSKGVEFGTTTGRPRRCGWLDLQLLRYSSSINGYSALNVTKLDVLTGLDVIQVCIGYKVNGKLLSPHAFPAHLDDLAQVEPEYVTLRGWSEDISKARKLHDLPAAAQEYLKMIESQVGVHIKWVGVGADREDMVFIQHQ